jgi:hypothetical protein
MTCSVEKKRDAIRFLVGIGLGVVLAGCPKKDEPADAQAAGSASASPYAQANATVASGGEAGTAGEGGAAGAAKGSSGAGASFHGKYTLKPSTMYIPDDKDWKGVKFKNDESKHVGDGDITIDIDPSGRVSGSSEGGALGAAIIDGSRDGADVTATIRRKDPADEGLMGTLVGKIAGDKLEGTMRLSDANASSVREASFAIAKK